MIRITLPDGTVQKFESGITPLEVARSIGSGLAKKALVARVDGKIQDLKWPIEEDAELQILTWDDEDGKKTFWHSTAHLMAEALQELYPGVKFGIGPAIDQGFYYDVDLGDERLSEEDLERIEEKMLELAKQKSEYQLYEVSKKEAKAYYEKTGNPYKLELIDELEDGEISFCDQGNFTDLCKGPHINDTGAIKAVKLTNVSGAYWRGDERNTQMTRIYGISFPQKKMLDEYLEFLEEAKRRDHRKLGRELGLFTFSQQVGQGLPLWLPKGAALRDRLEDFLKGAQKDAGYEPVISPHIGHKDLYLTSGHYEKYQEDSFQPIQTPNEGEEFLLKPMNCPHHCEIFRARPHSYRDLPVRYAEFGTVYRYEQSGELHGLTRVRGFTQDDAHIFCRADQVKKEFLQVIDLVLYIFRVLGFDDYKAQVSLRDPNDKEAYIGSDENWEKAEQAIQEAADEKGMQTEIIEGEAAFYGPKLDFMVRDALQREWQLGTIQVDHNLPERFDLSYTGRDDASHRPVMIHRAPFGSMERFVAILTEHCEGKFPLWLIPVQVKILPISERFNGHASDLVEILKNSDIRAESDERNEKVNKKIREAELEKVPYMLIVGEKEVENGEVSVRKQGEGDLGSMTPDNFAEKIREESKELLHGKPENQENVEPKNEER
ncbi:MAG: threonine--tRNA ligase [Flavobacteriales bacterium]